MSLKAMKAYLGERGVDYRGCIEKGDFRNLAASTAAAEAGGGASQAAAAPVASAGGGVVEAETEPVADMAPTSSRGGLPSSTQRDSLLPADGSAEARKQAFFASMQADKVRVAPKLRAACRERLPFRTPCALRALLSL